MLRFFICIFFITLSSCTSQKKIFRDISSDQKNYNIENLTTDEKLVLENKPRTCKKSKVPLFKKQSNIKVQLFTDMTKYFKEVDSDDYLFAILSLQEGAEKPQVLPVYIQIRGNSRASDCEYKPIRFLLPKQVILDNLFDHNKKLDLESDVQYIQRQVNYISNNKKFISKSNFRLKDNFLIQNIKHALKKVKILPKASYSKVDGFELFSKLGNDVKFVTHCGLGSWLGNGNLGNTDEGHNHAARKVEAEALTYQIFSNIKLPMMKVRPTKIQYIDIKSNNSSEPKFGFFRENPKNLAKRCKLSTQSSANKKLLKKLFQEERSNVHGSMVNHMIGNTDYYESNLVGSDGHLDNKHNLKVLYGKVNINGEEVLASVPIPYDFDLTALTRDENSFKYKFEDSQHNLRLYLRKDDLQWKISSYLYLKYLFKNKAKILKIVSDDNLMETTKNRFKKWYDEIFIGILEAFFNTGFDQNFKIRIDTASENLDKKIQKHKDAE